MKITTKTAKELQQEMVLRNKNKNNRGYVGLCSIKINTIINVKNELKEIIKPEQTSEILKELMRVRLRLNRFIQEIESVEYKMIELKQRLKL